MIQNSRQSAATRGYGYRWIKYRATYLIANPLCVSCAEFGRVTQATVVDHKQPHKGDYKLFWDPKNHQPMCKPCHDKHKQRLEKSGVVLGCNVNGIPIDSKHHWVRAGGSKC